jgi:hypothetical protein
LAELIYKSRPAGPTVTTAPCGQNDCTEARRLFEENKRPKQVPAVIPESDQEIKYYESALRRRQMRLIISGKMKPEDAPELKAFFTQD